MSLVFDALKQHREPAAAPSAASLGSVLPDANQHEHTRVMPKKSPVWLSIALLLALAAGISVYHFSTTNSADTGDQKSLMQPSPASQAPVAAAPGATAQSRNANSRKIAGTDMPQIVKLAGSVSPAENITAHTVVARVKTPVPQKTPVAKLARFGNANASIKVLSSGTNANTAGQSTPAPVLLTNNNIPQSANESHEQVAVAQNAAPGQAAASAIVTQPLAKSPIKTTLPANRISMEPQEIDLMMTQFNDAVRDGDMNSAKALMAKVSAVLGADSLVALRMHGFLALKTGDLRQAREDYQRVVASLQNDYEANRNLAVIDVRQGNTDLSKKRSKHMLEIYPDDPVFKVLAN